MPNVCSAFLEEGIILKWVEITLSAMKACRVLTRALYYGFYYSQYWWLHQKTFLISKRCTSTTWQHLMEQNIPMQYHPWQIRNAKSENRGQKFVFHGTCWCWQSMSTLLYMGWHIIPVCRPSPCGLCGTDVNVYTLRPNIQSWSRNSNRASTINHLAQIALSCTWILVGICKLAKIFTGHAWKCKCKMSKWSSLRDGGCNPDKLQFMNIPIQRTKKITLNTFFCLVIPKYFCSASVKEKLKVWTKWQYLFHQYTINLTTPFLQCHKNYKD